jgi:hypothetical protein
MSVDFYDRCGHPFAYSDDAETLFTFSGKPIAHITSSSVYLFSGKHVGFFEAGHVRDHSGFVLLFTNGARGGPMKPLRAMRPLKSARAARPMKSIREMPAVKPVWSTGWSLLELSAVFFYP